MGEEMIERCRGVQTIAKTVLDELGRSLSASDSEHEIVARAVRLLEERGITETWYYDCPALVLASDRTCLSQSGKDYVPSTSPIGETTLVTVDLSPVLDGFWGDCARSFFLEEGSVMREPRRDEFSRGKLALTRLHETLRKTADPEMTLGELAERMEVETLSLGFRNVDFLGNFGHTIEKDLKDRSYLMASNEKRIGMDSLFTFEPHIVMQDGCWGFKHEEIYYLREDGVWVL